jgi:exonuclease III
MPISRLFAATAAAATLALLASPGLAAEAVPTSQAPTAVTAQAAAAGTAVRFATFNVRTSRADIGTSRQWLRRALSVAQEIKDHNPGIVAIQELGPGRADGKRVSVGNGLRQTTSLLKALDSIGASKYNLTRTTAYVKPGAYHGTQGTRILFDSSRYRLVTRCVETTGTSNWNPSCGMVIPNKGGPPSSAAFAEFEDRSTGRNFFVISGHLDSRHSGTLSKERSYDAIRAAQIRAIDAKVNKLANGKPIIFGGDINSWRTKAGSHAPFNYLYSKGFRDSARAANKIDAQYPTVNHWKTTLKANAKGRQVALDVIMLNRGKSFSTYENVMKVVDSSRASDHNMQVANLVL